MAATTPDGLVYPSDPNAPADVIADMRALANSTQTALNNHMNVALTFGTFTLASGWTLDAGTGSPAAYKSGRMCISKGSAVRTGTDLAITAGGTFQIGTVPAGYRPNQSLRVPASWYATNTSNVPIWSTGLLQVIADGTLTFTPPFAGKIQVGQWVSFAGLAWVTP